MKRILQITVMAAALAAASLTGPSAAGATDYIGIGSYHSTPTYFVDANGAEWYGPVRFDFGFYKVQAYYSYDWSQWLDCYTDNTFVSYGCIWR
jgi:opacity protein-like surface antigen